MNNIIELKNINKNFCTLAKEINAIDDISFNVKDGEIISLIGPSGCGKSTLLSIICNLENNYHGNIKKKDNIKIAYMLQSDALLSFLTIYENCLLGLKIKKKLTKENIKYVDDLLKLYNLDDFKNSYPNNLSGGMKQRVA